MRLPSRRMPKSRAEPPSGWRRVVVTLVLWGMPLALAASYLRLLIQAPVPALTGTAAIAGALTVMHLV